MQKYIKTIKIIFKINFSPNMKTFHKSQTSNLVICLRKKKNKKNLAIRNSVFLKESFDRIIEKYRMNYILNIYLGIIPKEKKNFTFKLLSSRRTEQVKGMLLCCSKNIGHWKTSLVVIIYFCNINHKSSVL